MALCGVGLAPWEVYYLCTLSAGHDRGNWHLALAFLLFWGRYAVSEPRVKLCARAGRDLFVPAMATQDMELIDLTKVATQSFGKWSEGPDQTPD